MKPPLVLTTGDPGGIGPDLCLHLATLELPTDLVVAGDPALLASRAKSLRLDLDLSEWQPGNPTDHESGRLRIWPVARAVNLQPGYSDPKNAAYVLDAITHATHGCLSGQFAALVTGPINKASINAAGIPFSGHTEYIAGLTGGEPLMLLTAPGLRVALATTHLPLADVSAAITQEGLKAGIQILNEGLKSRFGIPSPRLLVAGLNPHAGEGGYLGREEIETISPALDELRAQGIDITGPLPADTLFIPPMLAKADAVMAMYHDQGLPVLKYIGFGRAVNITLGLPIIRTSVDHGTALDIAGTGKADPGSLLAAIDAANELVNRSGDCRQTAFTPVTP